MVATKWRAVFSQRGVKSATRTELKRRRLIRSSRQGRKAAGRARTLTVRPRKSNLYSIKSRMPVPEAYLTKLRYTGHINLIPSSANLVTWYTFKNSLFDPDETSIGHQPLWRDQFATMYQKYRCYGMKYRFLIQNTNTQQLAEAYILYKDDLVFDTNPDLVRERSGAKRYTLGTAQTRPTIIKGYMPSNKAYGISKGQWLHDDSYEADWGATPFKPSYLCLGVSTMNAGGATFNVCCDIVLYAKMFDRINVTQS